MSSRRQTGPSRSSGVRAPAPQAARVVPVGLAACLAIALGGCASVDPRADFQRSAEQVRDHTGAEDSFDPDTEAAIEQRVMDLREGGLTVDEAVALALLNNPSFQAIFQDIGVSRADVVQSGLLSNPTLSLGFRLPEGGGRAEVTAGLAQQIVDLWQIPMRKRIAEAQLERTVTSVVAQATVLAADVRDKYYRLLASQRAEELAAENLHLIEQSLELAQARLRAGDVGPLDVNLVRMNLLDAQVERESVRQDLMMAELALAGALGLSRSDAPVTLDGALPKPQPIRENEDDLLTLADERRLDLRAAGLALTAAENELERECMNVFPSIVVGIAGERTERRGLADRDILADTARSSIAAGKPTAPSIQSRAQRDQARRQVIDALLGATVAIALPIWDQNQAHIAKARFEVIRRRKLLDAAYDGAARQVKEAFRRAMIAQELAEFFEDEVLPQATQNVEGARSLYRTGEQGVLALLEAQEMLVQQRRRSVSILQDYALARVDLELAVGGRLPEATGTPSGPSSAPESEE